VDPLLLITPAESGGGDDLAAALEVLHGHASVEVCETSSHGELDGILHRAGSRPIVVAGDDRSVHAVIATLHRRNDLSGKVLGLLPLGPGNHFARTVGLPLDPVEAAKALVSSVPQPRDLMVDELGEVVVNTVHIGPGALAVRRGASWKDRLGPYGLGIVGRPLGTALAAVRPPSVRLHVEVDGEVVVDVDRRVTVVAIGGRPGDGSVDVRVSFAESPRARLGHATDVLRRRPGRDDSVHVRGAQVSISGEAFWLSADGDVTGPEGRRTWHVERAAYSMLLPR